MQFRCLLVVLVVGVVAVPAAVAASAGVVTAAAGGHALSYTWITLSCNMVPYPNPNNGASHPRARYLHKVPYSFAQIL